MMKDLAIVVALADGAERETVARRLRDRLNPLGRRHVTIVTAPVGGREFWDQLYGPLQAWGADHIVGDEAYVCLDHEPGLREWTSSATTQFQFMVRVSSAAERREYEGQPLVNTLEAEDVTTLVNMVMAVTPPLDPDDLLSGAFIGVEPMMGAEPDAGGAPLAALDDADGMPDLAFDAPAWAPGGATDGGDEPDDLEDLDASANLMPDEEAEVDALPAPSRPPSTASLSAMASPDQTIDASPDAVEMASKPPRLVASIHEEEDPGFDITPAESVVRPAPARAPVPNTDSLAGEPDIDDGDAIGEAGAVEVPADRMSPMLSDGATVHGPSLDLQPPVAAQHLAGSDPDFFGEFEHVLPPALGRAVVPDPSPVAGPPPQAPTARPRRRAAAAQEGIEQADVFAEGVTPHPLVMYTQFLAEEQQQSAPSDRQAVPAPPRPALKLPSYAGPETFPEPIADVWNDVPEPGEPLTSDVREVAPVDEVRPAPSPPIPDERPPEPSAPEPITPLDEEPFSLDLDIPADPWGYLGDPEPVAPAPVFTPPVQRASARVPSDSPRPSPARPQARAVPTVKSDGGSGLVGTLLSRLRSQGAGGNTKGKGRSFGMGRRIAMPKAPKRQYTDEELAGFLDSGFGGIVVVGALKGGVGKTATSNVIADIAGKILSTNNASSAWVDGNTNNPDAGGFFRDEMTHSQVSVQVVVAALTNGDVVPEPLKATAESVALYPEAKGVEEYSKTQLDQFQQYLRRQHRLSVVDLANVLPAWGNGPAASAALFWLEFADVIVVPTDLNPTSSLPDACDYIRTVVERFGPPDSASGKPIFVPYIVPDGRAVISDVSVQEALQELEALGATLYPVPYKAMVMLAGAHHQSLDSLDKELSLSYRALTEAVIVAFADARERAGR